MGFVMPKGSNKVPMTIRIDEDDFNTINKVAKESKKSLNEVACAMIKYAINTMDTN